MLAEKNLEAVLDALGEKIRSLQTDIMIKDMDIDSLKKIIVNLKAELLEATKFIEERETDVKN